MPSDDKRRELERGLSEIEEYVSLGYIEDARLVYAELTERFGDHPALLRAGKELGRQVLPPAPGPPTLVDEGLRVPTGARPAEDTKAKRLARLVVSEIKLYHEQRLATGHSAVEALERLNEDIESGRQWYRQRLGFDADHADDHFRDALVEFLAIGDAGFPEAEPKPAVAPIADSLRQPFLRLIAMLKRVLPAWHHTKARAVRLEQKRKPAASESSDDLLAKSDDLLAEVGKRLGEGSALVWDTTRQRFEAVSGRPDNVRFIRMLKGILPTWHRAKARRP